MKQLCILLLFVFSWTIGSAQQTPRDKIDSLQNLLLKQANDTTKVNTYKTLVFTYAHVDSAKTIECYEKGISLAKKLNHTRGSVALRVNFGYALVAIGRPSDAIVILNTALVEDPDTLYPRIKASALSNRGRAYSAMGLQKENIESLKQSLKVSELFGVKDIAALASNNLGTAYSKLDQFDKSIKYFLKAKDYYADLGNEMQVGILALGISGIAAERDADFNGLEFALEGLRIFQKLNQATYIGHAYNGVGTYYFRAGRYEEAQTYYDSALAVMQQTGNPVAMAYVKGNIASLQTELGQWASALITYHEIADIYRQIPGATKELGNIYNNISTVYIRNQNYKQALRYAQMTINESGTTSLLQLSSAYKRIATSNEELGNHSAALAAFKEHKALEDSITKQESINALNELKVKYENKERLKDIAFLEQEQQLTQDQLKQEKNTQAMLWGGIAIVILLLVLLFARFRTTSKQKALIAEQKDQVEAQRAELEEKNKEVSDSIRYAVRFQRAIFPSAETFNKYLDKGFVLFLPKDVVSGDFFWVDGNETYSFFAAADCTGHGVPGALVSVLCSNLLNSAVNEAGLVRPADILNHVRDKLSEKFMDSKEDIKDGMDIALCAWNRKTMELEYAGANNPLYLYRGKELTEVKADKQPVGKYVDTKPFTNHVLEVKPGDRVYLFSDGFADQFGGPKGKKFKYSALRKLLAEQALTTPDKIPDILKESFKNWKGELEQIDDVCILGVEIPDPASM